MIIEYRIKDLIARGIMTKDGEFREADHPRDPEGKFTESGVGGSTSSPDISRATSEHQAAKKEYEEILNKYQRHNKLFNEGHEGYNPHSESLRQAKSKLENASNVLAAHKLGEEKSKEESEWTPEATRKNREKWNGIIKTWQSKNPGKQVSMNQMLEFEKEAGFKMATLKKHVQRHGLK